MFREDLVRLTAIKRLLRTKGLLRYNSVLVLRGGLLFSSIFIIASPFLFWDMIRCQSSNGIHVVFMLVICPVIFGSAHLLSRAGKIVVITTSAVSIIASALFAIFLNPTREPSFVRTLIDAYAIVGLSSMFVLFYPVWRARVYSDVEKKFLGLALLPLGGFAILLRIASQEGFWSSTLNWASIVLALFVFALGLSKSIYELMEITVLKNKPS